MITTKELEVKDLLDGQVEVYSHGIVCCSVCALKTIPIEQVIKVVNIINPTGIRSDWQVHHEKTFKTGEKIPYQCPDNADRQHWLLEC